MKPKIISFFKELASTYASLNPSLSMCYHMTDNEMYLGGVFGNIGIQLKGDYSFEGILNEIPMKRDPLFEELIINWDEKKVKCFFVDGMYFLPGKCDNAIIFGKDLHTVTANSWMIQQVNYKIIRL